MTRGAEEFPGFRPLDNDGVYDTNSNQQNGRPKRIEMTVDDSAMSGALRRVAEYFESGRGGMTVVRQVKPAGRGHVFRLSVSIRDRDRRLVEELVSGAGMPARIAAIAGGLHEVVWASSNAIAVLERIRPLLKERAADADELLDFWHRGGYARVGSLTDNTWELRETLYMAIRARKEAARSKRIHARWLRAKEATDGSSPPAGDIREW